MIAAAAIETAGQAVAAIFWTGSVLALVINLRWGTSHGSPR